MATSRKRGFTLVELMVVILILGIIGTIAVYYSTGRVEPTKWESARTEVSQLQKALNTWALTHNNEYPDSLEAIAADFPGGRVPHDPFTSEPYLYERTEEGFELTCFGKDGVEGGAKEEDRDIVFDQRGQFIPED